MKWFFKYLFFLFIIIECQQKGRDFSRNNTCILFDPNKPCWSPNGPTKNKFKINEANTCRPDNLPKNNYDLEKIEQYVLLNDLSVEEEQDFKDRAENNELTIEELKILDAIILDKPQQKSNDGPICRKKGCPYYKCYRKRNCTCC
jgi:hypothetical protein